MTYQGPDYQTGPRLHGPVSGPQRAMSSGARDPARGFPPGRSHTQPNGYPPETAHPQDDGCPEGNGYAQGNGHAQSNGYAQGNGYSPVSGYRPSEWHGAAHDDDSLADGPPARDPSPRRGAGIRRLLRRPVVLSTAAALVLAAGGGVAYHFATQHHSTVIHPGTSLKLPATNPTAGSPYFSAKLGKWQHISTRKQDPTPLSVTELFPPAFQLPDGGQFSRAAASVNKDCTLAVFGQDMQTALQSPKCSQVLRASYVSGNGKMMGTIGVVNLDTANDAQQAGKLSGPDELIAPLAASRGPAKNLLNGTGMVYAVAKGHYLILMYVEFTSTKTPSGNAQKLQLVNFAQDMFKGSASISLSHRMLYGKPAPVA
ncbi:MAG: hypothetical protein JO345_07455 [Streptosporangiaceae bacterium]|nr:hypothetical protein [Streptosporangiaceae bacterium]